MIFYCPHCWNEMAAEDRQCGRCGAHLFSWDEKTFAGKLLSALSHPESQTQMRAVAILGEIRAAAAVGALAELYRSRTDPFLQAAIVKALGRIGGEAVGQLLTEALRNASFIVRREAADVLTESATRKGCARNGGKALGENEP